jgi:hypothetical protein
MKNYPITRLLMVRVLLATLFLTIAIGAPHSEAANNAASKPKFSADVPKSVTTPD